MVISHPTTIEREFALRMAFQPIVNVTTGEIMAYEALVRGAQGEGAGEVLARVTREQRREFDRHCRETAIACAAQAGIRDTDAMLAINFMPDAIVSPVEDGEHMVAVCRQHRVSPRRLLFEFSQQGRFDPARIAEIIKAYRRCGFCTVLDDFGGDTSALALLQRLAPDYIKLDVQLIAGIASSWSRRMVVENLVTVAREQGILVIAEGIETAADITRLRGYGIQYFQGYHVCQPALDTLPVPDLGPLAA